MKFREQYHIIQLSSGECPPFLKRWVRRQYQQRGTISPMEMAEGNRQTMTYETLRELLNDPLKVDQPVGGVYYETLQETLKHVPEVPGIYQMLNEDGRIIYIGKSKCLKKRVSTYFVENPKWDKAKKMQPIIQNLSFIVTDTHLEAKLLECEMIKKIRPQFNVMMKNDQKYFYIKAGMDVRRDPLLMTWEKEEDTFGPFRSRSHLESVMAVMKNLYPLKEENEQYSFIYHVFPQRMSKQEFMENRRILCELFSGPDEMNRFVEVVEQKMMEAAENAQFETAMKYRDFIVGLQGVQRALRSYQELVDRDWLYMVPMGENIHKLFFIHGGMVEDKIQIKGVTEKKKVKFAEQVEKEIERKRAAKEKVQDPEFEEDGKARAKEEKAKADYRDIIYAELFEAPEGVVEQWKNFD